MKESDARIGSMEAEDTPSPFSIPGVEGNISWERYKALPTETKSYLYHVFDASKRGELPMTYDEFKNEVKDPTQKQLYDLAREDPEFAKWLMEYRKAGSTTINMPPGEKAFETAKGRLKAKVTDPEFFFNTQKQLMEDQEKWYMPPGLDEFIERQPKGVFKDRKDARNAYNYARVLRAMKDQIAAAWGVPTDDVFFDTKTGYFLIDGLPIAPAPGGLR